MRKNRLLLIMILSVLLGAGCQAKSATKPTTANAAEALSKAGGLPDAGARLDFLLKEARGFVDTKRYDDGALLAEHILERLDSTNEEARRLARKAYEHTMGSMVGN